MFMIIHKGDEHGNAVVLATSQTAPTVSDFMAVTEHPDFRRRSSIHIVQTKTIETFDPL